MNGKNRKERIMITELDIFQKECDIEFDELSMELSFASHCYTESDDGENVITRIINKIMKLFSDLKDKLNEFFLKHNINRLKKELAKPEYKNVKIDIPDYKKLCKENDEMFKDIIQKDSVNQEKMKRYRLSREKILSTISAGVVVTVSAYFICMFIDDIYDIISGREKRLRQLNDRICNAVSDNFASSRHALNTNDEIISKLNQLKEVSGNDTSDIIKLVRSVSSQLDNLDLNDVVIARSASEMDRILKK